MARKGGRGRDLLQPCSPWCCAVPQRECHVSPQGLLTLQKLQMRSQQLRTFSRPKPNNTPYLLESRHPSCRINLAGLTSALPFVWGCQEPLASCTKGLVDLQFHGTVPSHRAVVPAEGTARDGPRTPCASMGEAAYHSPRCRHCPGSTTKALPRAVLRGAACTDSSVFARTSKGRTSFCPTTWSDRLETAVQWPVNITWPCTQLAQVFLCALL